MSASPEALAIELAEIRAEVRHIVRTLDKVSAALDALVEVRGEMSTVLRTQADHEHRLRSLERKGYTLDAIIAGLALVWPFLARKLGLL